MILDLLRPLEILKILTLNLHCVLSKDSFEERILTICFITSMVLTSDSTTVEISWWKFGLLATIVNLSPFSNFFFLHDQSTSVQSNFLIKRDFVSIIEYADLLSPLAGVISL